MKLAQSLVTPISTKVIDIYFQLTLYLIWGVSTRIRVVRFSIRKVIAMSSHTEPPVIARLLSKNIFNKFRPQPEIESDLGISSSAKLAGLENNQRLQPGGAIAPYYSDEDPELTPGKWWSRRRQTDLC